MQFISLWLECSTRGSELGMCGISRSQNNGSMCDILLRCGDQWWIEKRGAKLCEDAVETFGGPMGFTIKSKRLGLVLT
jgi:hypothetical protein